MANGDSNLRWGAIDDRFQLRIPYKFEWLGCYSDGLMCYGESGKCGFCDNAGNVVLPARYKEQTRFREGVAGVVDEGNLYGYINQKGTFVIPARFDYAREFDQGKAIVETEGKYGYIRMDGSFLRKPNLDYAEEFSEGLAAVRRRREYFYIDENGKRVGPSFDAECGAFVAGQALCRLGGRSVIINKDFEIIATPKNSQYGWWSLSPKEKLITVATKSGKLGYADYDGNIVLAPKYDYASVFYSGRARISKGTKAAFLAFESGRINQITDFIFDESAVFGVFKDGYAVGRVGEKAHFVRMDGSLTTETFASAQLFSSGLAAVAQEVE